MTSRFHRSSLPAAMALATLLGACGGSFRVVRRAPAAGELALAGDPDEAREQAEDYMRRQCPEGYDVLDEGEAVVGSRSTAYAPGYGRRSGFVNVTTSDIAEWRIRYRCKEALAPAATVPVPRPAPVAPASAPRRAPAAPREPAEATPPAPPPARSAPAPADSSPSSWGTFEG
ncbi:MAG TPA: hypothetical protein VFS43_36250 [Polyangiaceae bacterium]|nr:hypothetical protein [Polyangiaceae bacterium]